MTSHLIRSGQLALGWDPDQEDWAYLSAPAPLVMAAPSDPPRIVDPEPWMTVKNQGSMSSCEGHALSEVGEFCQLLSSGGNYVRLSAMACYLFSQAEGGNFGRDSGAQIAAGVRSALTRGFCREETFPYPGRYSTVIPQGAIQEAGQYRIQQHTPLRVERELFSFLSNLLGGVLLGIDWTEGLADTQGYITLQNCGGDVLGGHAVCLLGYRFDDREELWYKLLNSHGTQWGLKGWGWVHWRVVEQWMRTTRFGQFAGLSDLPAYERRILNVSLAA